MSMQYPPCDFPLTCGPNVKRCVRPAGHTQWSLMCGWPTSLTSERYAVTVYSHSVERIPYDEEVYPYVTDGSKMVSDNA